MNMRIYNAVIVSASSLIPDSIIDICDGKITGVYQGNAPLVSSDVLLFNAENNYMSPGFIDIHVHGGGGIEFMNADPQEIQNGCTAHALHGTTTIVPTSLAANPQQIIDMIQAVKEAKKNYNTCTIAGVHLEGPFLSPKQSGAQSPEALLVPRQEIWDQLLDVWPEGVRIMGVAPELPGALDLASVLSKKKIVASIAHSDADYNTCKQAMQFGFSDVTHIYSGCSTVHRVNGFRYGGVVEAGLLEDKLSVQVIADGCHLPPELLKLIYKCKGAERISLITDALFAAGSDLSEGTILTQANGMQTVLEDGVMKMPNRQAFAGSIATMDRLVRNMVKLADVPLWDAVKMATLTPARVIGVEKTKGTIQKGKDADLVLFDRKIKIKAVISNGCFIKNDMNVRE